MALIYDEQLSSDDNKIVKGWWKDCSEDICRHGYVLSAEFIPPHNKPSRPPPNRRSFNDIARRSEILIVCIG
jgi:hypothetical protein